MGGQQCTGVSRWGRGSRWRRPSRGATSRALRCLAQKGAQQTYAKENAASVDLELEIAVDLSYSMDLDELAVQREGYAQAIAAKEFLEAIKVRPNSKVVVTYFEGSASNDQRIIIPCPASVFPSGCCAIRMLRGRPARRQRRVSV
ncbi:DUF1194 domain-containing protein [Bradyrhizobium erythrophlei]|uniref:DUF1194 domain-containing protein n=1 Tax=Bradyrhizobium erythrophlei TaxID=1437360 RepID=UPI0035EC9A00